MGGQIAKLMVWERLAAVFQVRIRRYRKWYRN
nr:MAG TPA: hypothetical protein [Caudoviricetes sp.]